MSESEHHEFRRINEFLFGTPQGDGGPNGFGRVPSWLQAEPVSRPVKLVRYIRYRWWRALVMGSYYLGRDSTESAAHRWLFDQDCRASCLWFLAQIKHNQTLTIKGLYPAREEETP